MTQTAPQAAAAATAREIEEQIRELLAGHVQQASAYGPAFAKLWDVAAERILGGKLLRPRLLMGAFDALAPEANDFERSVALRIAATVEILHYAFLLHDDVIDEDLLRRGQPNLIGEMLRIAGADAEPDEQKLRWARTNAILMGNLLLSLAHQSFAREPLPLEIRTRMLDLLDHTITESVAGELADVGLSAGVVAPDLGNVLQASRLKTATYTFELPLRAAVVLTGADPNLEEALAALSHHLGTAFQLQDDLLSTFGEPKQHGKDAYSDFREGKETAIIAYARMTRTWAEIEPSFGRHQLSDEEGRRIQRLLTECGAAAFISSLIDGEIIEARKILNTETGHLPPALGRFVLQLVDTLEGRRS